VQEEVDQSHSEPTTTMRTTVHLVVKVLTLRRSESPKEPRGCVLLISYCSTHQRFGAFKISTHSTPLTRRILSISRPSSWLEGLSTIFSCHECVCTTSSSGLPPRLRAEGRGLVLWVHHFGSLLNTDNEDGSPARQKVQETTQIFPTGYLPGNPNQHRRWATRLPNTVRHRPQR